MLMLGTPDVSRVEGCFEKALEIARRQQAKILGIAASSRIWCSTAIASLG